MVSTTHTEADYERRRPLSKLPLGPMPRSAAGLAGYANAVVRPDTWATFDGIATGRAARPYAPTYVFQCQQIDQGHRGRGDRTLRSVWTLPAADVIDVVTRGRREVNRVPPRPRQ